MRDVMIDVVHDGTGHRGADPRRQVGGKTGTAQTGRRHVARLDHRLRRRPTHPTIAVAVIVESQPSVQRGDRRPRRRPDRPRPSIARPAAGDATPYEPSAGRPRVPSRPIASHAGLQRPLRDRERRSRAAAWPRSTWPATSCSTARSRSRCCSPSSPADRDVRRAVPPRGPGRRQPQPPQHRRRSTTGARRAAPTSSSWSTSTGGRCRDIIRSRGAAAARSVPPTSAPTSPPRSASPTATASSTATSSPATC